MTDLKVWLSRRKTTMCDLTHDYFYKTKTNSMSRVEVCEWQPRKGTHSSTKECIVALYTPPSTLSKHNKSQTHTMSHLLPWDPQWLIETTFSMTVVNGTCTNRNCSNTQWNTWRQEPLWPLTACKQQLQTLYGFTMSMYTHTGTHTLTCTAHERVQVSVEMAFVPVVRPHLPQLLCFPPRLISAPFGASGA